MTEQKVKRIRRDTEGKTWNIVEDDGEYMTLEVSSSRYGTATRVMRHREYDNKRCYYTYIPIRDTKEDWL